MASRSSRSGRGARCARGKRVLTHSSDRRHAETDAAAPNKPQGQNLGMGSCHGLLLTKRVGMSSRLGAGVCSSSSVPRATVGVLSELGRPISLRREAPSKKIRGAGSRVGLGIRHDRLRSYRRVRGARSSRSSHPSMRGGEVSRSMARAESDPYRTRSRHRSRPSEERRCLPPHGRANGPCGGRKRRRYVMPPCTGKVVGSLG
jgi:hypothetical protein